MGWVEVRKVGTALRVEVQQVQVSDINLRPLGRHLLGAIRRACEDPAVEAEFQAWKAERNKKEAMVK